MNPGRKQYTLGSLMLLIAFVAVGLAFPEVSGGLIIGAIIPLLLLGFVAILQYGLIGPCWSLIGFLARWLASATRPPAGREP